MWEKTIRGREIEEDEQTKQETQKEEALVEYAKLVKEEAKITYDMDTDPKIRIITKAIDELNNTLEERKANYIEKIIPLQEKQISIKADIVDLWCASEGKTFKCDVGSATIKTTRSLCIKSTEKLIDFLISIKKLPEFIKSFEIAKLRKIKEAGLLGNDIATWDEKQSVSIKLTEDV